MQSQHLINLDRANAELNNPQYQQTQSVLNNSNPLQRYLGQMGEIRSVFAPTFDSNAGQAGTIGPIPISSLLTRTKPLEQLPLTYLLPEVQWVKVAYLVAFLSMIPGTPENTYKKQAENAQAQLNALGIAGSAPTVAQSGGSIPALTSMAGQSVTSKE